MALSEEYVSQWQKWHDERIKNLNRPYGFLSIVSQDWLTEGELFTSEFVPGQWLLKDGEIYYHPDLEDVAKGNFMVIDGENADSPTHVPHGHNKNSGTGSRVSMFYKDLEAETITRLNAKGEVIYAVRVRDPREVASKHFEDIETFPLDEKWIVPAKFTPSEIKDHTAQTVEGGIYEAGYIMGMLELVIDGQIFNMEVSGHRAGSLQTGYFTDDTRVHFGDQTNGKESYGGGRVIRFDPDKLEEITQVDFNKAVSLPCALSTFVACVNTPPGNRLPLRITAGEFVPPVPHERVATYKG